MSADLLIEFAMNQRKLRKLRITEGRRPGSPFNGEGYAVLVHVLDRAQAEPGSDQERFIYFESLDNLVEATGVSKSNAQKALKRFCAVGLLIERGKEHHSGYHPTMTYEVNVDLLTGGRGLVTRPTPSRSERGSSRRSERGSDSRSDSRSRIPQEPELATESASNLNHNVNHNSNPARDVPAIASCSTAPAHEGCNEENEEHRTNVEETMQVLLAHLRNRTTVKNRVAWERTLRAKYLPAICKKEPLHRDKIRSNSYHETRRLVDLVMQEVG